MSRKIFFVSIRTIDEKNHIQNWTKNDIDINSIKFKIDNEKESKPKQTKTEPKIETKTEPKKQTKKSKKQ